MIIELARGPLSTQAGEWIHVLYWDGMRQAIAMVYGDVANRTEVLCRVHSSCITAHVFLSIECDCREQLEITMRYIAQQGAGVVIWLDQEGRANGMMAHIASQELKRQGLSQSAAYEKLGYPSDAREYLTAAEILQALQVKSIVVLTNNPNKIRVLRDAGLPLVEDSKRVQIKPTNALLEKQYRDKVAVDGHLIDHDSSE